MKRRLRAASRLSRSQQPMPSLFPCALGLVRACPGLISLAGPWKDLAQQRELGSFLRGCIEARRPSQRSEGREGAASAEAGPRRGAGPWDPPHYPFGSATGCTFIPSSNSSTCPLPECNPSSVPSSKLNRTATSVILWSAASPPRSLP